MTVYSVRTYKDQPFKTFLHVRIVDFSKVRLSSGGYGSNLLEFFVPAKNMVEAVVEAKKHLTALNAA